MKKISGILNTGLSRTAGRFVSGNFKITGMDLAFRPLYYRSMLAELFEHLLLFDEVAIIINIDNSPLGILIAEFGIDDTARLIESGAVKLILRRTLLTSKVGNIETGISELDGIPPVIPGMIETDNHFGDPVKSIEDSFRFVKLNYSKRERDMFLKRVLPFIVVDSSNTNERAIKLLVDAYHSNSLSTIGLPYIVHENSLDYKKRGHMLKLASEVTDLMLIASNNYGMYNQDSMYNIASKAVGEISNALHISSSMNKLTTVAEQMPDLKALYFMDKVGLHSVVNIRNQSDSQTFRNWINDRTKENNPEYIIKEYIDSIAKQSGFFASKKGKLLKSMMSFGVSLGVGGIAALAVPTAPLVAGVSAIGGVKLAEHFSNEFLNGILSGLMAGWTPKQYLDTIKKTISD